MASHTDPSHDSQSHHRKQTLEELLRFRVAMDISGDAIYLVDRTTMRFVDVNQTACTRMGYTREELLKIGPQDLLNATREEIERRYDEVIAAGASGTTAESTARTKDGRESITELHRRALRTEEGWIIVSIARDITRRKQMEQELLASEMRFRLTFELAGSGIAHVDLAGRFRRVNRSLCEILGYSENELIGRTVKELSHPEDRDKTDAARSRLHSGEVESARSQKRYLRKDGSTVWVNVSIALMRDVEGKPLYEISVFDDETERKNIEEALQHANEKLEQLALHDPLTGLANRRKFAERFNHEIERAARIPSPLSLLMIDIDHFKAVNDRHGHPAGDACLKELAARLTRSARTVDLVARFGGEEFVVLLPDTSADGSLLAAERMRFEIQAQPFDIEDGATRLPITVSVGTATVAGVALTSEELLARADEAVYRAKRAGRNQVCA